MAGFKLPQFRSFYRATCGATVTAAAAALVAIPLLGAPASAARGPDGIADVAERVIDAVVNVSTSQSVDNRNSTVPSLPPGSPFEEFFDEFFKNRRGQQGQQGENQNRPSGPRRVNSLGSGFIIDPSGFIATNKHVVLDATSIAVVAADGVRYKASVVGMPSKSDMALLRIDAGRPLPFLQFGNSDKMRVGDTVIAIGSPFGLDIP
jgi:serine protease Do